MTDNTNTIVEQPNAYQQQMNSSLAARFSENASLEDATQRFLNAEEMGWSRSKRQERMKELELDVDLTANLMMALIKTNIERRDSVDKKLQESAVMKTENISEVDKELKRIAIALEKHPRRAQIIAIVQHFVDMKKNWSHSNIYEALNPRATLKENRDSEDKDTDTSIIEALAWMSFGYSGLFVAGTGFGKTRIEVFGSALRHAGLKALDKNAKPKTLYVAPTGENTRDVILEILKIGSYWGKGQEYIALMDEGSVVRLTERTVLDAMEKVGIKDTAHDSLSKDDFAAIRNYLIEKAEKPDKINVEDLLKADMVVMSGQVAFEYRLDSGEQRRFLDTFRNNEHAMRIFDDYHFLAKGGGLQKGVNFKHDNLSENNRLINKVILTVVEQVESFVRQKMDAKTSGFVLHDDRRLSSGGLEMVTRHVRDFLARGDMNLTEDGQNIRNMEWLIEEAANATVRGIKGKLTGDFYFTVKNGTLTGTIKIAGDSPLAFREAKGKEIDWNDKEAAKARGLDKLTVNEILDQNKDFWLDFVLADEGNTNENHIYHSAIEGTIRAMQAGATQKVLLDYLARPEETPSTNLADFINKTGGANRAALFTGTPNFGFAKVMGFDVRKGANGGEGSEFRLIGEASTLSQEHVYYTLTSRKDVVRETAEATVASLRKGWEKTSSGQAELRERLESEVSPKIHEKYNSELVATAQKSDTKAFFSITQKIKKEVDAAVDEKMKEQGSESNVLLKVEANITDNAQDGQLLVAEYQRQLGKEFVDGEKFSRLLNEGVWRHDNGTEERVHKNDLDKFIRETLKRKVVVFDVTGTAGKTKDIAAVEAAIAASLKAPDLQVVFIIPRFEDGLNIFKMDMGSEKNPGIQYKGNIRILGMKGEMELIQIKGLLTGLRVVDKSKIMALVSDPAKRKAFVDTLIEKGLVDRIENNKEQVRLKAGVDEKAFETLADKNGVDSSALKAVAYQKGYRAWIDGDGKGHIFVYAPREELSSEELHQVEMAGDKGIQKAFFEIAKRKTVKMERAAEQRAQHSLDTGRKDGVIQQLMRQEETPDQMSKSQEIDANYRFSNLMVHGAKKLEAFLNANSAKYSLQKPTGEMLTVGSKSRVQIEAEVSDSIKRISAIRERDLVDVTKGKLKDSGLAEIYGPGVQFSKHDKIVQLVQAAQELGFTNDEIRMMLGQKQADTKRATLPVVVQTTLVNGQVVTTKDINVTGRLIYCLMLHYMSSEDSVFTADERQLIEQPGDILDMIIIKAEAETLKMSEAGYEVVPQDWFDDDEIRWFKRKEGERIEIRSLEGDVQTGTLSGYKFILA